MRLNSNNSSLGNCGEDPVEVVNKLSGTALRIFLYALRKQQPIGVRETQRALGLKVPSHAQYHLNRLEQLDVLKQTPGTKYVLKEPYKSMRSFKISVLTEIYLIKGRVIPAIGFLAGYALGTLLTTMLLYWLASPFTSMVFTVAALALLALWALNEAIKVVRNTKDETSKDNKEKKKSSERPS